jgi:cytochrome d ubiquinol oxidase subunit I
MFAFFLESSLLGLVLFGEKKLGPRWHFRAAVGLWFGTWLSGYFIVTTNAWMQRPVGYEQDAAGLLQLTRLSEVLLNPWALWAWVHAMLGAVTTAGFFVASIGAYYLLVGRHEAYGRSFVRLAVWVLLPTTILQAFPTGDRQARLVHDHQPAAFAAMEGHFDTPQGGAPLVLIGQPDMDRLRIDNPVRMPNVLSFLTHKSWNAPVQGLKEFPRDTWPDNIPLLYYAYHVMVGLGTLLIALAVIAAWKLRRGTLFTSRPLLWALLLALPFPYVANTAGWMTAELGRQPWVVYGVLRTSAAYSTNVSAGNAMFSLLGFFGIYSVLSALFLLLVVRKIAAGPEPAQGEAPGGFGHGPARPEA